MMKFVPLAIEELASFKFAAICRKEIARRFPRIVVFEKSDSSFYVWTEVVVRPNCDRDVFVIFFWPRKYE
jgi:hypothetical protein